jgi:hypothetical protein
VRACVRRVSRTVAYMGPSGSGQVTKLLNNAMTMSNLNYAVDLIRLVSRLGMDEQAVIDVIAVSSGGSTILRTLRTDAPTALTPGRCTTAAWPAPAAWPRPSDCSRRAPGADLQLGFSDASLTRGRGSATSAGRRASLARQGGAPLGGRRLRLGVPR